MFTAIGVVAIFAAGVYAAFKYGSKIEADFKAGAALVEAKYEAVKAEVASIEAEIAADVKNGSTAISSIIARIKGKL